MISTLTRLEVVKVLAEARTLILQNYDDALLRDIHVDLDSMLLKLDHATRPISKPDNIEHSSENK